MFLPTTTTITPNTMSATAGKLCNGAKLALTITLLITIYNGHNLGELNNDGNISDGSERFQTGLLSQNGNGGGGGGVAAFSWFSSSSSNNNNNNDIDETDNINNLNNQLLSSKSYLSVGQRFKVSEILMIIIIIIIRYTKVITTQM